MRSKIWISVPVCLIIGLAWWLIKAADSQPILLGFSGPLTGINSELGVQGRNGATLAVEDINAAGGINGRRLILVSEDDAPPNADALRADKILVENNVVAIIGHMLSASTLEALPYVKAQGIPLISPTTAAPVLSDIKDVFFRVITTNQSWATFLATYSRNVLGLEKVYLIGDSNNKSYTDSFLQTFAESFTSLGGTVVGTHLFSSRELQNWGDILIHIRDSSAQSVVLCAQTSDAANFVRELAASGNALRVLCPSWPYTKEFLMQAGRAANDVIFATGYAEENENPALLDFKKRYQQRFGWAPSFAAVYAYEAVNVAAKGLRATDGRREGLVEALQKPTLYHGLQGDFELNQFGDVKRSNYLMIVKNGRFVNLAKEDN